MQFAILFTFAAAAMAASIPQARQATGQPSVQNAAMSTQDGTVVAFDTAGVYLDSVAKGL